MRSPFGTNPTGGRPPGEVRPDELVAAVLVGVPDDDDGVASDTQDPVELPEDRLHPVEEGPVVRRVGDVVGVVADHRVVGPAIGMRLGERTTGHRERQLDVVGRVGRDEVDRALGQGRQDRQRVAEAKLQARWIEPARTSRVGRAEVRDQRPGAVTLGEELGHDPFVDRDPARIELDAQGVPGSAGDGRTQQGPADAGERVQDELAGPAEELDQPGHQPGRLVRAMGLARDVSELGRIRGGQHRLGEVQPLLTGQVVQLVGGMGGAAVVGHAVQRSRARSPRRPTVTASDRAGGRPLEWPACPPPTRVRGSSGERTRSPGSRRCSSRHPPAMPARSWSTARRASAPPVSSTRRSGAWPPSGSRCWSCAAAHTVPGPTARTPP